MSDFFEKSANAIAGVFNDVTGCIIFGVVALAVVLTIAIIIISAVKGKKEKDDSDVLAEFSEYDGIDGFVAPCSTDKQELVKEVAPDVEKEIEDQIDVIVEDQIDVIVEDQIVEVENQEAPQQEQSQGHTEQAVEPIKEEPLPVVNIDDLKEEVNIEEVVEKSTPVEPVKEQTPKKAAKSRKKLPVPSEENPVSAETVPLEQRQGDWSVYDGEYDGYYYDPIDVTYYEGKAPIYVQKLYLPKVERVVRTIKSPAAPNTDKPKTERTALVKEQSDLMSNIYGQYLVEHTADGEYYFTLYSKDCESLYESYNYSSEQYCRDAIDRFRKHVLAGTFSVEGEGSDYHYTLVRKLNKYEGPTTSKANANALVKKVKAFAQTPVVKAR